MSGEERATLSDEGVGQQHHLETCNHGDSGQADNNGGQEASRTQATSLALQTQVLELLSTKLDPSAMTRIQRRVDLMQRSSFYLDVFHCDRPCGPGQQQGFLSNSTLSDRPCGPGQQQGFLSNSTLSALIDPWRLTRMRRLAGRQVKIQLSLLEELQAQVTAGRQDLEALLAQQAQEAHPDPLDRRDQKALQDTMLALLRSRSELQRLLLTPGRLHLKHRLIPDAGGVATPPPIGLSLSARPPLLFHRPGCYALTWDAVVLRWAPAPREEPPSGPAPGRGGERFEVHFRPVRPGPGACGAGGRPGSGTLTSGDYGLRVDRLSPDTPYRFSVKRVDACGLVHGAWSDALVLQTPPGPPTGSVGAGRRPCWEHNDGCIVETKDKMLNTEQ